MNYRDRAIGSIIHAAAWTVFRRLPPGVALVVAMAVLFFAVAFGGK